MFVRPASRWLYSPISVTVSAIGARISREEKLEDGLEKARIEMQRDMNKGQVGILEGDHDVSWVSPGRKVLCWGANIKQANPRPRRGTTSNQNEAGMRHKVYREICIMFA